jgi:hypothetical protein
MNHRGTEPQRKTRRKDREERREIAKEPRKPGKEKMDSSFLVSWVP